MSVILTGLLGSGIQKSGSPAIHMKEAAALGLELTYRLFDTETGDFDAPELGEVLRRLAEEGYSGVNVTHPFKLEVLRHLDLLSEDVEAIGACNTVIFSKDGLVGHNTDWRGWRDGFLRSLPRAKLDRAILLGAGGAGAAVSYAALSIGLKQLHLFDVDAAKSRALAERLIPHFGADRVRVSDDVAGMLAGCDGLINTTPIGMDLYPGSPVKADWLRPELWVADAIYFPPETQLLADARRIGCATMNGVPMVVYQAVEAFELFTGVIPDVERMFQRLSYNVVAEV